MSIFVSTTFTPDNTILKKTLEICKNNKIQNIEIGSNHKFEKNYDYINNFKFNYVVHNYFPVPKNKLIVNIASKNDLIFENSIKHIKSSIRFSKKIGAKLYTFHPGFI